MCAAKLGSIHIFWLPFRLCVRVFVLRAPASLFRALNQMENHRWPSRWKRWRYKIYNKSYFSLIFFFIFVLFDSSPTSSLSLSFSFTLYFSLCSLTLCVRFYKCFFLSSSEICFLIIYYWFFIIAATVWEIWKINVWFFSTVLQSTAALSGREIL